MTMEEERLQEIRKAFLEYTKENELSAFDTPHYFAKQILPKQAVSKLKPFLQLDNDQRLL